MTHFEIARLCTSSFQELYALIDLVYLWGIAIFSSSVSKGFPCNQGRLYNIMRKSTDLKSDRTGFEIYLHYLLAWALKEVFQPMLNRVDNSICIPGFLKATNEIIIIMVLSSWSSL